jgi:hypothetical protein
LFRRERSYQYRRLQISIRIGSELRQAPSAAEIICVAAMFAAPRRFRRIDSHAADWIAMGSDCVGHFLFPGESGQNVMVYPHF